MSKPIDPKTLGGIFHKVWADYDATRQSRFIRKRTGVAPQGGSEDYNFRQEIDYYNLIEQARDMDRNDGLVGTLADRRVDNIVQQGFTLDTKTGDKKLDQDLWQRWQAFSNDPEACDIAGELCWHEMERLVCRAESIDGDIVVVGTEEGSFQTIEAHAIQTSTRIENTFLGVTRDIYGRREQYHVRYDLNEFGQKSESTPIDVRDENGVRQLFHVYDPKRVSGTRGVTQLAPVFALSGMLEDINFAKLVQQQIVSCFAILRSRAPGVGSSLPSTTSPYGEPSTETTRTGSRVLEGISPGMEIEAEEGETLSGFSPNVPNSEYFQQVRLIMQIVGVNFGLPLCLVLMDGSETNFSGWRGAVDEARKGFVADQMNLVRRLHTPAYTWWLHRQLALDSTLRKAAKRTGISIFGHQWQLPTWSYIEPVADAEGDTAQLRNALTSPRRMHAARGKDWETIAEEIIDDNVYAISAAQSKANEVNKKFPDAPPLSWRDLIPLPMPEGQTLAMQDPNAIKAQEEEQEAPEGKPTGRGKKKPRAAEFDESKVKRDDDGQFGSGGGGGKTKESLTRALTGIKSVQSTAAAPIPSADWAQKTFENSGGDQSAVGEAMWAQAVDAVFEDLKDNEFADLAGEDDAIDLMPDSLDMVNEDIYTDVDDDGKFSVDPKKFDRVAKKMMARMQKAAVKAWQKSATLYAQDQLQQIEEESEATALAKKKEPVALSESEQETQLLAEIMLHVFGDDAEQLLYDGEPLAFDESKVNRNKLGQFVSKGSPEAFSAAKKTLKQALSRPKTKKSANALAEKLSNLTVKQLTELKKEYGIKASGRTKQQLVDKLADRLDRGRRQAEQKKKTVKKKTPVKKKAAKKKAPEAPEIKAPDKPQESGNQPDRAQIEARIKATGVPHRIASSVSPEFLQTTAEALEKIPASARKRVAQNGNTVVVGEFLTDVKPELKGVTPRGWPDGYTWDHADGFHDSGSKTIAASEFRIGGTGLPVKSRRTAGVVSHEFGHAFDDSFSPRISISREFIAAYNEDKKGIADKDRPSLAYFLQAAESGRSEAVAEGFAIATGQPANQYVALLFQQSFPRVMSHIEKLMQE